jgi:glutathione S-transferase
MQLIGMLDSPFVRRVAITMELLGIPYQHRSVSVFSGYDQFRQINPVVKAPTLVCDDGEVLMDSTLIIDYLEMSAGRSLMSAEPAHRRHALRLVGLALAACEKTVQIMHEKRLRPPEKQHEPWLDRIGEQLRAALLLLEPEADRLDAGAAICQAGVTVAVSWRFTQIILPESILAKDYPALAAHSARAERLPAFIATPPL